MSPLLAAITLLAKILEVYYLLAALYISTTLQLDSSLIHFLHSSLFPLIGRRLMTIDHRIVKLCRHRDRYLRVFTTRCATIKAALGSVWFKQYRKTQDKIDFLQCQVSRIIKLCRHHNRRLRFVTTRYTLEAAKRSKWYQEYRRAQVRIDYLQCQA